MLKKLIFVISCFILVTILSSCVQNSASISFISNESFVAYENMNIEKFEHIKNINVSKYDIPNIKTDNEYISKAIGSNAVEFFDKNLFLLYTVNSDEFTYYIYQHDIWTTMSSRFDIYKQDRSGKFELIYVIYPDTPEAIMSVVSFNESIFFSTFDISSKWHIYEFCNSDYRIKELSSGDIMPYDRVPILSINGNSILWYTNTEVDIINLNSYNCETNEFTIIASDIISNNPYERATGAYAYNENGKAIIVFEENIIHTECSADKFSLISAKNGKIIWSETSKSGNKIIYMYDIASGLAYKETVESYMGAGILNGYFFINRNRLDNDILIGDICFYNLCDKEIYKFEDKSEAFAFTNSSQNKGYITVCTNEYIYVFEDIAAI